MSESKHELIAAEAQERPATPGHGITRRLFLQRSTATLASAGVASIATAVAIDGHAATAQDATPGAAQSNHAGMQEAERPAAFFNIHEAATVDALVSRILPGSADDPGAHEAGVVFYIDRSLGGTNLGYTLKTYTQGPFPVVSEEPVSVEAASNLGPYHYVSVPADEIGRFGFQSVLAPQEIYRRGIEFVDAYAQSQFKKDFVDLDPTQQDSILTDMAADKATGFDGPSGKAFFTWLRNGTIEGMFSDPMYGGNRDMVGWKLIGYPGAQRTYSPADLKNTTFTRAPQTLGQMMANEGH